MHRCGHVYAYVCVGLDADVGLDLNVGVCK